MAANPLRIAQDRARHDNRWLAGLFARYIGGAKHPRGAILSAYRDARKNIAGALKAKDTAGALRELDTLRFALSGLTYSGISDAVYRGNESAIAQVNAYREDGANIEARIASIDTQQYASAILSAYDAQATTVKTLVVGGAAATLIVGDASRIGALKPGPVMFEAARWFASALHGAFKGAIIAPGWNKQAIPVFDEFTTDCCLNVAGQIVPLDGLFHLTGTPRFADSMDWSPFHAHCRTSIALYQSDYDDGLTEAIEGDAQREIERRLTEAES